MRIVSLLPSATEILFALGLADQIVGVTHECDFPPEARSKPHLTAGLLPPLASAAEIDRHVRADVHAGSSLYALDAALLDALAPDLIVTQELCAVCAVSYGIVVDAVRRSSADPRIVSLEPSSLEDVYATIVQLGELTGTAARAAALVASLRTRAQAIAARAGGRPRVRALVLEWTDPPKSGGHWTPGLLEAAGGTALLGNPGANSRTLAWETIAAADPEVIIIAPCGFDLAATLRAIADLDAHPAWRGLRAVAAGNVVAIDGNQYVNRPGPRLVESMELFALAMHPDLRPGAPFGPGDYAIVRA